MPKRADCYVYVLFRADGSPFYIGKGSKNRWAQHETRTRQGERSHRASIIRKMFAAGWTEIPKIKIAEGLTEAEASAYEIAFINALKRQPHGPLVNQTAGGEGMLDPSPEVRAKLSAGSRGKVFSPERRANIGAGRRGILHSPEVRAKLSEARRGISQSLETRAKRSMALRGKLRPPETCANISAGLRGNTLSPKTRAKVSASLRRLWQSPEYRQMMMEARH